MQNRVDRLEGLVLSLMTNGSQSAGPVAAQAAISGNVGSGSLGPSLDDDMDDNDMDDDNNDNDEGQDSETENVTKRFGVMKVDVDRKRTFYIGEAHWAALLNDIAEVRNYFQTHRGEYEEQMKKVEQTRRAQNESTGPALLFGATKPPSREEIMSQIPSRYISDILISRYFNSFDPAVHILHGPTFQKQYNSHWTDPSKTTIVWVGMLFAMFRLAMLSYTREGDEPPEFQGKTMDLAMTYRTNMAHCLILADYTKPHNHIIETLIFHLHGEYTVNRDTEASVWVLVGMIARLAMRMGYHRDSKAFPNITPFQGEMRRRIWTFVRQSDLLFSFQVALPSMIRIGDSDTELPRNIYDDEFDEDCAELPPARPASEATPVSYMIAKARLAFGFGRVLEEVNNVSVKGYDEILKIDRGLRDIYESIPEHLKLRTMAEQVLAPVNLIMARFGLATVYHKAQCVLHRRYLKSARTNPRYAHSRRTCLDSALALLNFQNIQHQETREKGRMRSLKKYVNSLTTHDFLLAGTILTMDLYTSRQRDDFSMVGPATNNNNSSNNAPTPASSSNGSGASHRANSVISDSGYSDANGPSFEDLLHALERSRDIWRETRDESMEAYKASEVMDVLLVQLRESIASNALGTQSKGQPPLSEKENAAMTLEMLSSGKSPNPYSLPGVSNQQSGNRVTTPNPMMNLENLLPNMSAAQMDPSQFSYNGIFTYQGDPNNFSNVFEGMGVSTPGNMNLDWVSTLS